MIHIDDTKQTTWGKLKVNSFIPRERHRLRFKREKKDRIFIFDRITKAKRGLNQLDSSPSRRADGWRVIVLINLTFASCAWKGTTAWFRPPLSFKYSHMTVLIARWTRVTVERIAQADRLVPERFRVRVYRPVIKDTWPDCRQWSR